MLASLESGFAQEFYMEKFSYQSPLDSKFLKILMHLGMFTLLLASITYCLKCENYHSIVKQLLLILFLDL